MWDNPDKLEPFSHQDHYRNHRSWAAKFQPKKPNKEHFQREHTPIDSIYLARSALQQRQNKKKQQSANKKAETKKSKKRKKKKKTERTARRLCASIISVVFRNNGVYGQTAFMVQRYIIHDVIETNALQTL